jgi:23S rRNA pseudouridine1911/1915/1917 synthase
MRLDQAIAARYPDVSRRKARELLTQHRVLVNDRPVSVASREVADNDRIAIVEATPAIDILLQNGDLIAVNKPIGIAVQPERERKQRSLEELLRLQLKRDGGPADLYVVHRIDTSTSGVVLFARTRAAAASLSRLFATRAVDKSYLALVEGVIESELRIETPIAGRDATSLVKPLRVMDSRTLVECALITGRTHQLRIHLSSIAHPIVGDRRYGGPTAARLMLHAWKIAHHDIGEIIAPPPAELAPL